MLTRETETPAERNYVGRGRDARFSQLMVRGLVGLGTVCFVGLFLKSTLCYSIGLAGLLVITITGMVRSARIENR